MTFLYPFQMPIFVLDPNMVELFDEVKLYFTTL
jgi:hypothetical protein